MNALIREITASRYVDVAGRRRTLKNESYLPTQDSILNNESKNKDLPLCLVDDDQSILKATARLLCSAGWKTEAFPDPLAFLLYAEANRPAVAVLDVWMPQMNGLEVQHRLRSVSPETCVVILTSKDDPHVRAKALAAGASSFFLKPVQDDEFLREIESIYRGLNGSRQAAHSAAAR